MSPPVYAGQPLPATAATLLLPRVEVTDSGAYRVLVTDDVGVTPSLPAQLTVLVKPTILVQPRAQTVVEGDRVTLEIITEGSLPMRFRWRRNGRTITNITVESHIGTYLLPEVQLSDAGNYTVVVANNGAWYPMPGPSGCTS